MAFCPVLHHVTLQCPANFLNFLQSENIGSYDGDPITTLTKLFACGKAIKMIQICKMPGKQNIISYISENDFVNFCCFRKACIISKNVLDSICKSLAPANIPTKIEMNILVRFEVIRISSFSERQLISRKFTAEVYKLQQSHIKVYPCVLSSSFNRHLCFKICLVSVL